MSWRRSTTPRGSSLPVEGSADGLGRCRLAAQSDDPLPSLQETSWNDGAVSGDLSLFGDDQRDEPTPDPSTEAPIADWQVDLLRKALDARDLTDQDQRREAIETAAGRPVESLRSLTHDEALRVLSRLGETPSTSKAGGSAWEQREEDTWIDRL